MYTVDATQFDVIALDATSGEYPPLPLACRLLYRRRYGSFGVSDRRRRASVSQAAGWTVPWGR